MQCELCYLNLMTPKLNLKVSWGACCVFNGTTNAIQEPITLGPRTLFALLFFARAARKIQKLDPLERANLRKAPPAAPSSRAARRAKPQCQSQHVHRGPLLFWTRAHIEAMRLKMRRRNPSTAAGPQLLHLT
jgi:hypothetical protein